MAENERSFQAGGNSDFDGLPRICFTASQVVSGKHCKTLETTVETSAWQPWLLITVWRPGSHQVRVRGCEPQCEPTASTHPMRINRAYFLCAICAITAYSRCEPSLRPNRLHAGRASRGPVREYAA